MAISTALTAFAALVSPVGFGWHESRRNRVIEQARRQARRDYQHLLSMDDHILSDIGLTRIDVEAALAASGSR